MSVVCLLLALFALAGASAAPVSSSSSNLTGFAQAVSGIVVGGTYELTANSDTFIDKKHKNDNYGTLSQFAITDRKKTVNVSGTNIEVEKGIALIGFDTSAVCDGGEVTSATLQIFGPASNDTGGIHIHEISESWSETGATWNNEPDDVHVDQDITVTTSNGTDTVTFDVTDSVVDGSGGFDANADAVEYGWWIEKAKQSVWYSRTWSDASLRPTLTIEIASC